MKRVVSLSLGSSARDKTVTVSLLGETFSIARIGVDGDQKRFVEKLAELDGTVDAIGFGGMDRYLFSDGRRYEFTAARRLLAGAKKTPVVDGSGLKNTLERATIERLAADGTVDFRHAKTLMVCGVDRFGMSEALVAQGGDVVFGDLMFALGVPLAIRSWAAHRRVARALLPAIVNLPIAWLYPMGEKQQQIVPKFADAYRSADILAGDFHYIRRHLPERLDGKTIITNTTTTENQAELAARGAKTLITTTPAFDGRSFGTNVMEAMIVASNDGKELDDSGYQEFLKRLNWSPTVITLNA